MKKVIFYLLFLAAFASAAVVSPSQSTMAILLDASGLCGDTSNSWSKLNVQEFLKNHAFYGDANSIYCRSYDESMTPSEAANSLFKGPNSIFNDAAKQNAASNLSRFVIIAEGAAGLAVREYIQSKDYQGEIDNVIFFNTPHEGTGFADQALLNGSSTLNKSKSVSDYSDIIPLALAVYLVGGSEALETLMMSLLKEAVLGMAQNAGDIKGKFNDYFKNKDESYKSLLYLAQDLDSSVASQSLMLKSAK
jgi:triacylglycerol esterase/lipase EstA (alpha/beta hydrolase family)